ncbi:DUF922 domain-containing protein [Dyella japonica]|nr:DUF922 domain-containing protein [Dyella japonica]
MHRAIFVAMAVFCSGLYAADAPGPVTFNTYTYDVHGGTVFDIENELHDKSPLVVHGRHMHGKTHWEIHYHYHWKMDGDQCVLDEFDATLNVDTFLPQWVRPQHPNPMLAHDWDRYIAALRMHERGHAEVGEDAREVLVTRAKAMGPAPTCDVIKKQVIDLVAEVVDAHRKVDAMYDDKTDHGRTQGAHFP